MRLMAESKENVLMEKIVSLCKRRGFIYQSSEIYGGINGFWDYGPLGAELKRNVKELWWNTMTRQRDDVVGLEATIIMSPQIWKASGHVDTFSDPMIDCKTCKGRFRADQTNEIPCPQKPSKMVSECHGEKTAPRAFNLMFQTYVGPVQDDSAIAYLRPETAQAIFAQFKNVLETSRQKVPFGIAQIGKAFRNEVTPRNFTFRSREFEQMELEFFIKPDEVIEAITGRVAPAAEIDNRQSASRNFELGLGSVAQVLGRGAHPVLRRHRPAAHDARGILAEAGGTGALRPRHGGHSVQVPVRHAGTWAKAGIAARSDFDLSPARAFLRQSRWACSTRNCAPPGASWTTRGKQELSKRYYDARLKYLTKTGVDAGAGREGGEGRRRRSGQGPIHPARHRTVRGRGPPDPGADLPTPIPKTTMPDEKGKMETRVVMKFHPRVAPIKVGVLPLLKNKPDLVKKAHGGARPVASAS